jgi:hypothetical protein
VPNDNLPEFNLQPNQYGWHAPLPKAPLFFGRKISLEIHTRLIPSDPPVLPPISNSQAALVRSLIPALPSIIQKVEREMIGYNEKWSPDFRAAIDNPHIWLSPEEDDGVSWTFVIESTQNPDFGWHAEFRGSEFIELWSGD